MVWCGRAFLFAFLFALAGSHHGWVVAYLLNQTSQADTRIHTPGPLGRVQDHGTPLTGPRDHETTGPHLQIVPEIQGGRLIGQVTLRQEPDRTRNTGSIYLTLT